MLKYYPYIYIYLYASENSHIKYTEFIKFLRVLL